MLKTHRRNGSGELDVFEAAFYFSGEANDVGGTVSLGLGRAGRRERRSLDASTEAKILQRPQKIKDQANKQPSSPGVGKLAAFFSSFFSNLTAARKKSSSESINPAQLCKNVEYAERPQRRRRRRLRRRRRNSIDHVDCTMSTMEKMTCAVGVLPWDQENKKSLTFSLQRESWHGNRVTEEMLIARGGCNTSSRRSSRRREEDGDCDESDSSSDLFELKSYDV